MVKKEAVTEITETEFSKIINDKKNPLLAVDFFAEWCMPCVMMGPVLEKVAEKNTKIKFCKMNVDDAQKTATQYRISSIPCIVFFKNGKEAGRSIGAVGEDVLESRMKEAIG